MDLELKKLKKDIDKLNDAFYDIKYAYCIQEESGYLDDLIDRVEDITAKIKQDIHSLKKDSSASIPENCVNPLGIKFYDRGDLFKIVIPGCLPKRAKNGKSDAYTTEYKKKLIESFNSYFYNNKKEFNCKVRITIRCYYESPRTMMDYDNTEVKPLIDNITRNMLLDDNPLMIELLFKGDISSDDTEYIEVDVESIE